MVIDDFFPEPDVVRNAALRAEYPDAPAGAHYPGRNSKLPFSIPGLDEQIGHILGTRLKGIRGTAHAKTRIALEGDQGASTIHVDPAHWTGVICLSRDEDCVGGTEFFTHKRTGTDRAPVYEGDVDQFGYKEPLEVWEDIINPETNDLSKWHRDFTIPLRYNRLILFRSYLWHTAGPGFGDRLENGRLVLIVVYQEGDLPLPEGYE